MSRHAGTQAAKSSLTRLTYGNHQQIIGGICSPRPFLETALYKGVRMKRLVPLGLAVALLLGIAVSFPTTNVKAQGAGFVSSLLNRMERNNKSLKSLRASVDMVKYN